MSRIARERIVTFWRIGYFELLDWPDYPNSKKSISTEDADWQQLFWRFYWRLP